jgi:hypothetical protein
MPLLASKETISTDEALISKYIPSLNMRDNVSGTISTLKSFTAKDILAGDAVGLLNNTTTRKQLSDFVWLLQTIEAMCKEHANGSAVYTEPSGYTRREDTRTIFELLSQARGLLRRTT